jgi:hypothetical protein
MQHRLIILAAGLVLVAGTAFAHASGRAMNSSSSGSSTTISGTGFGFVQMVHHRWHKRHHVVHHPVVHHPVVHHS